MKIGVLSLQGGVIEHINHIEKLGEEAVEIKESRGLETIDGLIIPGGESTAIGRILRDRKLLGPVKDKISLGLPVWGTCAGMILLAKEIENDDRRYFEAMDIKVRRNAYGSQLDSFETEAYIEDVSTQPVPLVFIRAPYIVGVGENVKILSRIDGNIVAVRQENMLATSFHPELTSNYEFHRYFADMCRGHFS